MPDVFIRGRHGHKETVHKGGGSVKTVAETKWPYL